MPKTKQPAGKPFEAKSSDGKRLAFRADGALSEQLAKLEILWGCTRQRVIEILASDAMARYYDPVLSHAMSRIKLADDGSAINSEELRTEIQIDYAVSAEGAAMIVEQAARRVRWRTSHHDVDPNKEGKVD